MPIDRRFRAPPRRATAFAVLALGVAVAGLGTDSADVPGALRTGPARASIEPAQSFEPEAGAAAARVVPGPGGADLRVAGDLMEGVAARVAAILAAHPDVRRIHLTSGGGLVAEGLALGELIAARGLATYVPDECASACTLAFVRGRARYLGTAGRLGFHAPYEAGPAGETVVVDPAPERAAYRNAGLDADFTAEALAVAPDDIWIPDAARLIAAGVVTEIVEADRFPDSTLDDDDTLPAARAQVLRNLPILADADPAVIDRLAAWYRDGYRAGRNEADAFEGLRQRANAHLKDLFRRADDATVGALGRATLAAMREAGDGTACADIAGGDLVAVEEILRAASHPVPNLPALVGQARRQVGSGDAGDGALRPPWHARRGPARCGARIEAVRRALDRPDREAAPALRALLLEDAPHRIAEAAAP